VSDENLDQNHDETDARDDLEDQPQHDASDGPDDDGPDDDGGGDAGRDDAGHDQNGEAGDLLEQEGDIAADYLEELLDIADLDGDLDMDVEGDRAAVSIVGADLSQLVGPHGEVLEALQELTRLAVYRETGERTRLMLDIGGYRADRRVALEKLAAETAARVQETGEPVALDAMTPFERKVVHDAVAAAGLDSESEGQEPRRHVVVLPRR
jgi:spoIIIJ-associated protein